MQKRGKRDYHCYVCSTLIYGVFALIGLISAIYFFSQQSYGLVIIALIVLYVGADNFFCGARAKKCGVPIASHYCIPPFLKR